MTSSIPFSCAMALAAALSAFPSIHAQTATLRTITELGAETSVFGNPLRYVIPPNTAITSPQRVISAQQTAQAILTLTPTAQGFDLQAVATVTNAMFSTYSARTDGRFAMTLPGAVGGWLTLRYDVGTSTFTSTQVRMSVTGPGVNEFVLRNSGMGRLDRTVSYFVAATNGYTLTCDFAVDASTSAPLRTVLADLDLRVTFTPALPPVRQLAYDSACGLTFAVSDATTATTHDVDLRVAGGFPSRPVAYLFGGRRAHVPIPGSSCLLLVEPIAAVTLNADAGGNASLGFVLPGPLQSAPFVLQALSFDAALQVRASQGMELQFVD